MSDCSLYGGEKAGAFPANIKATVQYGKNLQTMVNLGLIHCVETGTRIDGKTWWVNDASDMDFTYLSINRKRGQVGMDAAGILPEYHGINAFAAIREALDGNYDIIFA